MYELNDRDNWYRKRRVCYSDLPLQYVAFTFDFVVYLRQVSYTAVCSY